MKVKFQDLILKSEQCHDLEVRLSDKMTYQITSMAIDAAVCSLAIKGPSGTNDARQGTRPSVAINAAP